MNKIYAFVFFTLISLIGYNQDNNIIFLENGDNYVVKISCKNTSNEQNESLKKTLLNNEIIYSVTFGRFDKNIIKILCTSKKVEGFLLKSFKTYKIHSFKNIEK